MGGRVLVLELEVRLEAALVGRDKAKAKARRWGMGREDMEEACRGCMKLGMGILGDERRRLFGASIVVVLLGLARLTIEGEGKETGVSCF